MIHIILCLMGYPKVRKVWLWIEQVFRGKGALMYVYVYTRIPHNYARTPLK